MVSRNRAAIDNEIGIDVPTNGVLALGQLRPLTDIRAWRMNENNAGLVDRRLSPLFQGWLC